MSVKNRNVIGSMVFIKKIGMMIAYVVRDAANNKNPIFPVFSIDAI